MKGGFSMNTIGQRIRFFRNQRGITQSKLSEITQIEQTVISRYENGIIIPPITKLKRISQALEVPISELLGDKSA